MLDEENQVIASVILFWWDLPTPNTGGWRQGGWLIVRHSDSRENPCGKSGCAVSAISNDCVRALVHQVSADCLEERAASTEASGFAVTP